MGIQNFKLFLSSVNYKSSDLCEYDSIFVDIQSYLYNAIQNTFKSRETELVNDICIKVTDDLITVLRKIFSRGHFTENLKVIISFDGESVPMKYPTQKQRRNVYARGKNLFKAALFGHNTISEKVYNFIIYTITNNFALLSLNMTDIPSDLQFIICGSVTKGEGEHKLFYLGQYHNCRKPLVVSVDNDIYIIALSQLRNFDSIQIYKNFEIIQNINIFVSHFLTYNLQLCIYASLLFGNDFIPPVIILTESNCSVIHDALKMCKKEDMPHIFYIILHELVKNSKIRYKVPPQIEENMITEFWKNCFWVLDYYEKYNFPQKYMDNILFNVFDKNHIVTALLDQEYSENSYKKALSKYKKIKTVVPTIAPKHIIFTEEQLKVFNKFFPETNSDAEFYNIINIKRKK